MRAWRLVQARYAAGALNGEGARLFGGRWNSPGTRMVYLSDSPSLAALEILVHTRSPDDLASYLLFAVEFPGHHLMRLGHDELPEGWNDLMPGTGTQAVGDRWAADGSSLALAVPSAVVPQQSNFLLNPEHHAWSELQVSEPQPFFFDPRLTDRHF